MKITAIETIRTPEFPNLLWVQVATDEGLVGLGETFYGPAAAEGHIHGTIAPYLVGKDPRNIEAHQAHLTGYIGFTGASAEMRGRSAIDIALWDILGQSAGLPLCDLLGGRVRERIKVYNTCAGYSYVQTRPTQGIFASGPKSEAASRSSDTSYKARVTLAVFSGNSASTWPTSGATACCKWRSKATPSMRVPARSRCA